MLAPPKYRSLCSSLPPSTPDVPPDDVHPSGLATDACIRPGLSGTTAAGSPEIHGVRDIRSGNMLTFSEYPTAVSAEDTFRLSHRQLSGSPPFANYKTARSDEHEPLSLRFESCQSCAAPPARPCRGTNRLARRLMAVRDGRSHARGQATGPAETGVHGHDRTPGTTETNRKGQENPDRWTGGLTRLYRFNGPAWYEREVTIPETWRNKRVTLFLERTKYTQVWLDGKPCGENPILCTPQEYGLGQIEPGQHRLTIVVDNTRKPVNVEMHQMSDNTQGNWNGIIGRIELQAHDAVSLDDVQVFSKVANKSVSIQVRVANAVGPAGQRQAELCRFKVRECPSSHRLRK